MRQLVRNKGKAKTFSASILKLGVLASAVTYAIILVRLNELYFFSSLVGFVESSGGIQVNPSVENHKGNENIVDDPHDIKTFLRWVKDLEQDGEILLGYASSDYTTLAYNCILSLQKVGVENAGKFALDDESVAFFQARDIAAYNVAQIKMGIPEDVQLNNTVVPDDLDLRRLRHKDWSSRWNLKSLVRWQHWMLRHYLALQILKEGISVYQTDVDTVFLSNPYDWLDPDVDLEGQRQDWPAKPCVNFGIGHVKASVGGVLHWETTNNMMRYSGTDPQSIENMELMKPLIDQVGNVDSKVCREEYPDMECMYMTSPMISYRIWPEKILPMGYATDVHYGSDTDNDDEKNVSTSPVLGIHVHKTYSDFHPTQKEQKAIYYADYCKEHGVWYVPEEDEKVLCISLNITSFKQL